MTSVAPLVFEESKLGKHVLKTYAICGFFCVWNSETVEFTPPKPIWNDTIGNQYTEVKQFVTTPLFIGVQYAPTVPIKVKVHETTSPPHVQIGPTPASMQPPGTTITVTIPAGSTKGDFYVNGQTLGFFQVSMSGAGITPNTVQAKVIP